ncbi:MAG: hypothetical protein ACI38Z_04190 [Parafannyhessea sp.]|uniref:hypothetical protein n=1 Tax=Parafannyhessea sp. TaxID=2847324 RepID=UPI003F03D969
MNRTATYGVAKDGRAVYSNAWLRHSFYLDASQQRTCTMYRSRYVLGVAAGALVWVFTKSFVALVAVPVALILLMSYLFYYHFLTSLEVAPDDDAALPVRRRMSLVQGIVYGLGGIACCCLMVVNARAQGFTGATLTVNYVAAAAVAIFGVWQMLRGIVERG